MTPPTVELLAPDHPVKSITVYKSSKAKVVRTFEVEIKAGRTKINISKLPSSLDTNYVRFSSSSDDVHVLGVVSGVSVAKPEDNDSIRELTLRKSALESEKNLREYEADLLVTYAKTLSGENILPGQVSTFLDDFVERGKKNLGAVTTLTEQILAIERSIQAETRIQEETRKSLIRMVDARAHASVVLACTEPQTVVLSMTYVVSDVRWRPHYELHLTTPKPSSPTDPPKLPSATLYYYATISQRTGEDWLDSSLTLSTSSPFPTSSAFPAISSFPTSSFFSSQPQWRGQVGVPRLTPIKLSSPTVPAPGQPTFGQPSIPRNVFGRNGTTGTTSAFRNSNTGPAFGSKPTFGSAQPAQASANPGSTPFGSTQPSLAFNTTQSQPQPQPPPLFGANSSSHLPQNSGTESLFGKPTTNSDIAPGFGAFAQQQSVFGRGASDGLAPQQAQGTLGQSTNATAFSQPASAFGGFGGSQSQTQGTFGQSTNATASPKPTSALGAFGGSQQQTQGTFGQNTNSTESPKPAPSAFGAFGGSQQHAQPMFGQSLNAAASPKPTSSQQTQGTFGRSTNAATPPKPASSVFGGSQQQTQGTFGQSTNATTPPKPASSAFGGSQKQTFGQSTNAAVPSKPAPAFGAFGGSQQQAQGVFGQSTNTTASPKPAFGAFGGSQQQAQGAFGQSSNATAPPKPASSAFGGSQQGTFGQSAIAAASPKPTSSAFGGSQQQAQGAFGQSANATAPPKLAPSAFGGSQQGTFGQSANAAASPKPTSSAFGAFGGSQQQTPGTFGQSTNATAPPKTASSAFGGSQQQAQGTFGQSTNAAASPKPTSAFGAFGGSQQQTQGTFGQSANAAASSQPAPSGFNLFGSLLDQPNADSSNSSGQSSSAFSKLFFDKLNAGSSNSTEQPAQSSAFSTSFFDKLNAGSSNLPGQPGQSSTFSKSFFGELNAGSSKSSGFGASTGGTTNAQTQSAFGSAAPAYSSGGVASAGFGTPLFGGVAGTPNAESQQQPNATLFGSLFGCAPNTPEQRAPSGGLFSTGTNFNSGGGSLFGQTHHANSPTTIMIKNETSAVTSYAVDVQHAGDISSDGVFHQVTVAVIPLEVGRFDRVCVPRLGGQVWLQCQAKNTSELKLLAGPMTVIADDTHVAGISVDDISQADTFTCLLGDDPDVHLSYTLISEVVSASNAPQSQFAEAPLSKTTFTSKVVLWNKHPWTIRDVVVKEIVPMYCQRNQPSLFGPYISNQKVVLRKPEGLAELLEGAEVSVWVEVFNAQEMDPNVKIEEGERDYVEVDERDKEPEEKGKGKGKASEPEKPQRVKRVKAMWEETVDGMGGKNEGRFEWKCEEVGAGEKVVLEAQWETAGTPYLRWTEVST